LIEAKIFPYFFPLTKSFPFIVFYAHLQGALIFLHFLTAFYAVLHFPYNSNPDISANKKPCNLNGYRVFLIPILGCFPLFFPFIDFFRAFSPRSGTKKEPGISRLT